MKKDQILMNVVLLYALLGERIKLATIKDLKHIENVLAKLFLEERK